MSRVLMKGNEAMGEAAVRAGCLHFFGYPITPQTELPEYLVKRLAEVGGVFVQAESEVAAIHMVYGAAGVGVRCMTSSSSPGISLMAEGLSYIAACELPCVIVNVMRAGPGLGGILPAQSDYHQATRGHGHGDYQLITLAPASVQEAADLMALAFDLADRYRNPVMLCADGMIGQMMEPVSFPAQGNGPAPNQPLGASPREASSRADGWALTGSEGRGPRVVNSLHLDPVVLDAHNRRLKAKYDTIAEREVRWELAFPDGVDAGGSIDVLVVAFGTMARICKSATHAVAAEGVRAALFRPVTLRPWPHAACREAMDRLVPGARVLVVEMSMGQMIDDVRLAAEGSRPVVFHGAAGGLVPSPEEVADRIREVRP